MRVLAEVHTMNDAAVIEQLLDALRKQTRPPDAIMLVDNASTDDTLNRSFPDNVTIVRNAKNLGTSGGVRLGFDHALRHGFDWTWVFDADSVPEPNVLEELLAFYGRLPESERQRICFLACWPRSVTGEVKERPIVLEPSGLTYLSPNDPADFVQCDCTLWSGSLYRMAAVAKIGLPSDNYVLDIAEVEYGYRARELGFTSCIVNAPVIRHDVGREPGAPQKALKLGPLRFPLYEISPPRCYYCSRNWIYFWLYQCKSRTISRALRAVARSFVMALSFAIRPVSHYRHLIASLRGIRDGLTMHMERRF